MFTPRHRLSIPETLIAKAITKFGIIISDDFSDEG